MPYDSRETLVTRLTAIREAITAARTGQSVSTDGKSISRGNLAALLDEEREVLQRIEALDAMGSYGRGTANKVKFVRPI